MTWTNPNRCKLCGKSLGPSQHLVQLQRMTLLLVSAICPAPIRRFGESKRIHCSRAMIDGNKYIRTVETYFEFLEKEYAFTLADKKIRGNAFYDVHYETNEKLVSISYENTEDYLETIIFVLERGSVPNYDDKTKTLHLNRLTPIVFSIIDEDEISLNNQHFSNLRSADELERRLLKSAKELRLCLIHFNELHLARDIINHRSS